MGDFKTIDYDRDGPRGTGISKHTCNVCVDGPREKLRGPKGLKKGFLGRGQGDAGKAQRESKCYVLESFDLGSEVCSD